MTTQELLQSASNKLTDAEVKAIIDTVGAEAWEMGFQAGELRQMGKDFSPYYKRVADFTRRSDV